jgi:tetratricopeptide (TPR) repeat protein
MEEFIHNILSKLRPKIVDAIVEGNIYLALKYARHELQILMAHNLDTIQCRMKLWVIYRLIKDPNAKQYESNTPWNDFINDILRRVRDEISLAMIVEDDLEKALKYAKLELRILSAISYDIAQSRLRIGVIYYWMMKYVNAMEFLTLAYESSIQSEILIECLEYKGKIAEDTEHYVAAYYYYLNASCLTQGDTHRTIHFYKKMGEMCEANDQSDIAIGYYESAIEYSRNITTSRPLADLLSHTADMLRKDYKERAEEYYQVATEIYSRT